MKVSDTKKRRSPGVAFSPNSCRQGRWGWMKQWEDVQQLSLYSKLYRTVGRLVPTNLVLANHIRPRIWLEREGAMLGKNLDDWNV